MSNFLPEVLTFHQIVNGTTKGSGRWGIHITGGEALLKLMAPKEPHTPAVRMQFQFCFSAVSTPYISKS